MGCFAHSLFEECYYSANTWISFAPSNMCTSPCKYLKDSENLHSPIGMMTAWELFWIERPLPVSRRHVWNMDLFSSAVLRVVSYYREKYQERNFSFSDSFSLKSLCIFRSYYPFPSPSFSLSFSCQGVTVITKIKRAVCSSFPISSSNVEKEKWIGSKPWPQKHVLTYITELSGLLQRVALVNSAPSA